MYAVRRFAEYFLGLNRYGLIFALVLHGDKVVARRICPAHLECFYSVERYVELISLASVDLCGKPELAAVGLRHIAVKGELCIVTVYTKIYLARCFSDFSADEADENGKRGKPHPILKFAGRAALAETEIHSFKLHACCVIYRRERRRVDRIGFLVYHAAIRNASVIEMCGQRYLRSVNLNNNDHRNHFLLRIEGTVPNLRNGTGSGRIQV